MGEGISSKRALIACAALVATTALAAGDSWARDGGPRGGGYRAAAHPVHSHVGVGVYLPAWSYAYPWGSAYYPGWPYYGAPYYGYPYYSYPYYGYPPAVVPVPSSPPTYVEQPRSAPDADGQRYWYWCADPQGYYPTVRECPGGWTPVAPQPSSTQ